jgi:opacity protein-like surface antigen
MRKLIIGAVAAVVLATACASTAASQTEAPPTVSTHSHYDIVINGYRVNVVCDPHGYRVFFYDGVKAGGLSTEEDESCKR